jgi:hypothetical protein
MSTPRRSKASATSKTKRFNFSCHSERSAAQSRNLLLSSENIERCLPAAAGLDMTKSKDEYAKALKGKRHFKDERI